MRSTFFRALAFTAIVHFFATRRYAGQALEEGAAERAWMLYPVNVMMNALALTLAYAGLRAAVRTLRRAL